MKNNQRNSELSCSKEKNKNIRAQLPQTLHFLFLMIPGKWAKPYDHGVLALEIQIIFKSF